MIIPFKKCIKKFLMLIINKNDIELFIIQKGRKVMPIIVNVDVMLAKRKMSSGELAEKVGITPANLSILKTNKAKAIRFSTLDKICEVLDCKPGDILDYKK